MLTYTSLLLPPPPLLSSLSLSSPLSFFSLSLPHYTVGVVSGCQFAYLTDQGTEAWSARPRAISDQSEAEGRDQCEPDDRDTLEHEGHHFLRGKGPQPHHRYTRIWQCKSAIHNLVVIEHALQWSLHYYHLHVVWAPNGKIPEWYKKKILILWCTCTHNIMIVHNNIIIEVQYFSKCMEHSYNAVGEILHPPPPPPRLPTL